MLYSNRLDCKYSCEYRLGNGPDDANAINRVTTLGHYWCFGDTLSTIRNYKYAEATYHLYLYKEDMPQHNYNLCTKEETKKILRCIQKVVPFTYSFSQGKITLGGYNENRLKLVPCNVINFTVKGTPSQHVWVTTMMRCFFEYPYNVAAKETCRLQSEIKEVDGVNLEKVNWIDLYLIVASSLGSTTGHGFTSSLSGIHPKLHTYKELAAIVKNTKSKQYISDALRKTGKYLSKEVLNSRFYGIYNEKDLTDDTKTKVRISKYVAAYKDKKSWKN